MSDGEIENFRGIVVIGAGLVGAYTALCFARKQYQVKLIEYRSDFRRDAENETLNRSINLAFAVRAKEAIEYVGLYDKVKDLLVPMHGRALHLAKKKTSKSLAPDKLQFYDEIDRSNYNNSISRRDLNLLLLNELEKCPNAEIQFSTKLVRVNKKLVCTLKTGQDDEKKLRCVLVLGCDGAFSAVRQNILKFNFARFEQFFIPHGYKEFSISSKENEFQLPKPHFLHIWPRNEFMMIALPNKDKSFTCTLFAPLDQLNLSKDSDIIEYFKTNFPDFFDLIPDLVVQYKSNPTSRLGSVYVDDWKYISEDFKHGALLLGDAAHACVPFYGQGMNCGLEDALELNLIIDNLDSKDGLIAEDLLLTSVLKFNNQRVKDGASCSKLSYDNYREMSHHTTSSLFLFEKKLEGWLNLLLGKYYIPLYKMVAFTRIPYSEVIEKNKRQKKVLRSILGILTFSISVLAGVLAKKQISR